MHYMDINNPIRFYWVKKYPAAMHYIDINYPIRFDLFK